MNIAIWISIYLLGCIGAILVLKRIVLKYIDNEDDMEIWKHVRFKFKSIFIYLFSWLGFLGGLWFLLILSLTPAQIDKLLKLDNLLNLRNKNK